MSTLLKKMIVSLLMKLVSEKVLKEVIIIALEKVVALTKTDIDNNILESIKSAWNEV